MDVLLLPPSLRQEMLEHVFERDPEEACGLIGGTGNVAKLVVPVTNDLHSPVRFSMAPLELLAGLRAIEGQGMDLIAIFHSHPTGPVGPSRTDVEEFRYPGVATLIWSNLGDGWTLYGFWIESGEVRPIMVETTGAP